MNNEIIGSSFDPYMSLMIFKNKDTGNHVLGADLNRWYVESHTIVDGMLAAGKPLTETCFAEFLDMLKELKQKTLRIVDVMPPNLLHFKMNTKGWPDMIWFVKAGRKQMYFSKGMKIPDGIAKTPSLVFAAISGRLHVFATKGNQFPRATTQLYQPPFHNCSNDGAVCLGSAKVMRPEKITWSAMIEWYETMFWKTEFSHHGSAGINGNLNTMWKELITNTGKKFDTKVLIKSITLNQIMK